MAQDNVSSGGIVISTLDERIEYLFNKCQTAWWYLDFLEKQAAKATPPEAADMILHCEPVPALTRSYQ